MSPCGSTNPGERMPESVISVIDPHKQRELVDIRVCGLLGSAATDGTGGLYVTFTSRNIVARLDAVALAQMLAAPDTEPKTIEVAGKPYVYEVVTELDWRAQTRTSAPSGDVMPELRTIGLSNCSGPRGLAIDSRENRLFVGCDRKLAVLDSGSGASIASFDIGPGTDSIAYDAARGLIFTANGGGYGSVTIARQHLTDSYSVIQNLSTMEQARTMAIDRSTGMVYLVTTLYGANLSNPPMNGIGKLQLSPVNGSFQVLVIGN
jgi:DNA-binding beta-propeller fold protein YncE